VHERSKSTKLRRQRAPWGTISRQQIIDAAVGVVNGAGYEEMTIRGLAAQMGVAPMSLYRHVRDKDDLLNEVVDRLLTRSWRPRVSPDDWQAWVLEAADKLRHFLVAQPAALHVYLQHPVVSPSAIERMEAMMRVLRSVGIREAEAIRAYGALHTYTIGFAALEASRARWTPAEGTTALATQLAAYATPRQFAEGLRYLLEGIELDLAKVPAG
jgi:TetR/AcrR family tetracycline transcriptional repressor